ncbi:unnamed protein product [Owenia fusiformis]|uniref:Di-N-acetylchitobiase n=1 Tax=Owenia fusiformis TaxID=6347 RepID=A0A8J1XMB8_OWEFU|nr:unnamed protein product [Owenia fusiformis]
MSHYSIMNIFLMVFVGCFTMGEARPPCPCSDPKFCQPINNLGSPSDVPRREVFIFSLSKTNWKLYDWDKVTTVVMVGYYNPELLCYAHSKGARAVAIANIPKSNLTSPVLREAWIQKEIKYIQDNYLDGVNVDFEDAIEKDDDKTRDGLTALMKGLYNGLKHLNQNYQVTFDVPWAPYCIDGRCFDINGLATYTDFLFVMSYDERSQIPYECIAWANSAINTTKFGLMQYIQKYSLEPSRLVLGVPWYGYHYPCEKLVGNKCYIKKVPFRDVNCSDAAGREINQDTIRDFLLYNTTTKTPLWDDIAKSPYFTYHATDGSPYQIWYDNPRSLTLKYDFVDQLGLHGVGMWNADALDYSLTPVGEKQRKEMWGALPNYSPRKQENDSNDIPDI